MTQGQGDAAAASKRLREVSEDPRYRELVRRRSRFTWLLTAAILIVFFGYILLIAFDRAFLARPLAPGSATTLGIPIGIGVIVAGIVLTGLYVWRADKVFDPIIRSIRADFDA
jgi:uncharacterized membrane protein (DUF485 family)